MKQANQNIDMATNGVNKVFISHSSKDEEFVIKLVQFFEILGVKHNNIFCSSIEGQGVKHGNKIEEAVRNEIIEDKVLIYVISKNFLESNYCLNELGAGWVLSDSRTQRKDLFPIKLPDISFDDIKGFIGGGDKCTECNEKSITAFVEEFEDVLGLPSKKPTIYRNLVDNFIKDTKSFIDTAIQVGKLSKEEYEKQQFEKLKKILSTTTNAERRIIKDIFNAKSSEIVLNPTSAIVVGLQKKSIIYAGAGYYNYFDPKNTYALNTWVYQVFETYPDLKNEILS